MRYVAISRKDGSGLGPVGDLDGLQKACSDMTGECFDPDNWQVFEVGDEIEVEVKLVKTQTLVKKEI